MSVPFLTAAAFTATHGFFTREGGVSTGNFASLNGNLKGGDSPQSVAENRRRAMATLGAHHMVGLHQIHGTAVLTVTTGTESGAQADAMVTALPGVALGIITADCTPVLFADPQARIIGAAHAGWRGAVAGILEETIAAMRALGAQHIQAAIGPCIGPASFEVGPEVRAAVDEIDHPCFSPGQADRWWFDLPALCEARLRRAGANQVTHATADTYKDERFWSHRRRTHAGGHPIGHQMSVITL